MTMLTKKRKIGTLRGLSSLSSTSREEAEEEEEVASRTRIGIGTRRKTDLSEVLRGEELPTRRACPRETSPQIKMRM